MAQTIGVAGRQYGNGRVASMTKAINLENLSEVNTDFFVRLFLNSCLWACRNAGASRSIAIFSNGYSTFDNKLHSLFQSMGYFNATLIHPWYKEGLNGLDDYDLYVLIPSYNALSGSKMPDSVQLHILNRVHYKGSGFFTGEWFHLLHSIPSKRSFSFLDSEFSFKWSESDENIVSGLIDLSPFSNIGDNVIFTDAEEIRYSSVITDDSMSFGIPKTFTLDNSALDTGFKGHISQIGSVTEDSQIFWLTDVPSDDVVTTTTTTTQAPQYDDIYLKVFDVNLLNTCGPQKLFLDGPDADKFDLVNTELYLTKYIDEPQELSVNIIAEDYFRNERFRRVVENVKINLVECNKPVTLPKDGTYPAYSYRVNGQTVKGVWGNFAPTGVILPFEEWSFTGHGTAEVPAIGCLGGKHSDVNALWMQINQGGQFYATVNTSLEDNYLAYSSLLDHGRLFLVQNSGEYQSEPTQHIEDLASWSSQPHITWLNHSASTSSFYNYFQENRFYNFTFNVENPNSVDEEGNPLIDNIYAVLYFKKGMIRSEREDKICVTLTAGPPTTTPPPEFDFIVFVKNNVPNSTIRLNSDELTSFKFSSIATQTPEDYARILSLTSNIPSVGLSGVSIKSDSEYITGQINNSSFSSASIEIRLLEMPTDGGVALVTIDGANVTTTPPPPPPPRYPVKVKIDNNIQNVYLDEYVITKQLRAGWANNFSGNSSIEDGFIFTWHTSPGYEYRLDQADTASPYYTWYDRPTVTAIVSESVPGMTNLPYPRPSNTNEYTVRVTRGISYGSNPNLIGHIFVPVNVPVAGGEILLKLGSESEPIKTYNEPDATTTTTTTQPPVPCDNVIYVICSQILDCSDSGSDSCEPTSNSYQEVILNSCCGLSQSQQLQIIQSHNGSSSSLSDIYLSDCNPSVFDPVAPCLPKDNTGSCQETIHNTIIDVVPCPSSQNPLP